MFTNASPSPFTGRYSAEIGPLEMTSMSPPLIPISMLRRNNIFTSAIWNPFDLLSGWTIVLSSLRDFSMINIAGNSGNFTWPAHQTLKPFYISFRRQKSPESRENYASALHQVMILHLSWTVMTSCSQMVRYGRVHFACSQNIMFLCMKNWRKNTLFHMPWTQFFRPNFPGYSQVQFRYTFNDPFIVDFSRRYWGLTIITEEGVDSLRCLGQFIEGRPKLIIPLTGAYTNYHLSINS